MISSELAGEQEKDSFSTHPVLDSKPTRSVSIQEHINLDKMNKIQTTTPMSILDDINMSSIKSTQSVPGPKSSILYHIHFHETNKLNTYEKSVDEVCIFDDFPRF